MGERSIPGATLDRHRRLQALPGTQNAEPAVRVIQAVSLSAGAARHLAADVIVPLLLADAAQLYAGLGRFRVRESRPERAPRCCRGGEGSRGSGVGAAGEVE